MLDEIVVMNNPDHMPIPERAAPRRKHASRFERPLSQGWRMPPANNDIYVYVACARQAPAATAKPDTSKGRTTYAYDARNLTNSGTAAFTHAYELHGECFAPTYAFPREPVGQFINNTFATTPGIRDYSLRCKDPTIAPNSGGPNWSQVGGATLGMIGNGAGVVTAFGMAILPDPSTLTKFGAVALGLKSSYGFGANWQNFWYGINGKSPPSTGALVNDVTALALPGNQNAQRTATIVDLSTDFALGRIGTNAVAASLGPIENFPSMQRVFVRDPSELGRTIAVFQSADVTRNLFNEVPPTLFQSPPPVPPQPASPPPTVHISFSPPGS